MYTGVFRNLKGGGGAREYALGVHFQKCSGSVIKILSTLKISTKNFSLPKGGPGGPSKGGPRCKGRLNTPLIVCTKLFYPVVLFLM